MARKRFNDAEKALAAKGTQVEWQHVTHWLPGEVLSDGVHVNDFGGKFIKVRNLKETRTISKGAYVPVEPGKIRARQAPAPRPAPRSAGTAAIVARHAPVD